MFSREDEAEAPQGLAVHRSAEWSSQLLGGPGGVYPPGYPQGLGWLHLACEDLQVLATGWQERAQGAAPRQARRCQLASQNGDTHQLYGIICSLAPKSHRQAVRIHGPDGSILNTAWEHRHIIQYFEQLFGTSQPLPQATTCDSSDTASTAFSSMVRGRLYQQVQSTLMQFPQYAYLPGRYTMDAIHRVVQHCRRVRDRQGPGHQVSTIHAERLGNLH